METGTEFINTYGDIYEAFYNSLISMLADFCASILKTPKPAQVHQRFKDRLADLREQFMISDGGMEMMSML
jgi:hypothetical protein